MRSIFPLLRCQGNLILLFLRCKTLCKTWKNTCEFHLSCWNHVCKLNEWYLIDCFYREFRVSTRIIIVKCRKFSASGRLLMALRAIFSRFKIFTLIRTLVICFFICHPPSRQRPILNVQKTFLWWPLDHWNS